MKRKTVLLLGSYGQSNLGDDLLMWNYLELLSARGFQDIYVNANTTEHIPEIIKSKYPDLKIIHTYNTSPISYLRLISQVDLVVYGGGTLYKELYASTGRSPYSVIVRLMSFNILARLLGTKVYHLNIGIGTLKTRLGRFITKRAINAAAMTVFRDQSSYDFALNTLHIARGKIKKSTDGLFMSDIWKKVWKKSDIAIDRKKYKRVVGINVLSDIPDWVDRGKYIQQMRQVISTLLDQGNYVVFVPFQTAFNPRSDLKFMTDTFKDVLKDKENYIILQNVPIERIHAYLRQCDVFVGMRFHSLLLSTVSQVPFVALSYDTKCWRFIQEVNYPHAIKLEDVTYKDLIEMTETVFTERNKIKKQLAAISKHLYAQAKEDVRTLNL